MTPLFYITAAIAILAALAAITRREAMHGIFYLIVVLLALALLFFQLGAPFVAALEIIVYAGAIVILFLFVVMMINPPPQARGSVATLAGWLGPLLLIAVLAAEFAYLLQSEAPLVYLHTVSPKVLGRAMFGPYVYTLHLVALFLLVGLVGAFHLSRRQTADVQGPRSEVQGRGEGEP